MLTTYTALEEIRAALGVAEEEITDDVLSLPNYELVLQFDLEDLGDFDPTMQALYLSLNLASYTPTTDEARFISILRVYAAYVIARHLGTTLPLFAPKVIRDSKTELGRIDDPYKDTKAGVEAFYLLMQARLIAAYLVLFPDASPKADVPFEPLLAVSLGTDPVTGA